MLYAAMIVFFCFFYTALVFNSRETADNLKKSGAFIPGIRPGDQTAKHIDKILVRLTLAGAIYITFVCLLPEFLMLKYNVPFYFGGTSLLIIVVVTMDFMAQVQNYMMSQQYESLLEEGQLQGDLQGEPGHPGGERHVVLGEMPATSHLVYFDALRFERPCVPDGGMEKF
jgi:preprotein translocase subunit SecY